MTVADHLRDKPPEILRLYQFLHDRIRRIGPVTVDPQGRAIVFQVRARSIGLAPKAKWVDLALWLKRNAVHPRVRKVDDYGALGRILHFRITTEDDVDAPLLRLIEEAYAIGAQRDAHAGTGDRPLGTHPLEHLEGVRRPGPPVLNASQFPPGE